MKLSLSKQTIDEKCRLHEVISVFLYSLRNKVVRDINPDVSKLILRALNNLKVIQSNLNSLKQYINFETFIFDIPRLTLGNLRVLSLQRVKQETGELAFSDL